MKEIMTTDDVAQVLSVTRTTVQRWLRSGMLQGALIPGAGWRVTDDDVREFLKTYRHQGQPSEVPGDE